MANRYNVEAVKGRTNYMDGRGSAPVIVSAILEQGAITVTAKNTVGYKGQRLGMPSMTFAKEFDIDVVNRGDQFVQIATDTEGAAAFTYEACQGKPVVTKVSGTGGVAGVLLTYENALMADPSNTAAADTIAKRVASKFYAVEAVKLYGMEYHPVKVLVSGETAIVPGDFLTYDVSADAWVKDADGSAVMACHYATTDALYVGALFGPRFAVSQA
jgi:hypothetical protein